MYSVCSLKHEEAKLFNCVSDLNVSRLWARTIVYNLYDYIEVRQSTPAANKHFVYAHNTTGAMLVPYVNLLESLPRPFLRRAFSGLGLYS